VLLAARVAGVQAVDGPYLGIAVDDDFDAAVERARDLGFDGKWAIHPRHVEALDVAFTPTEDEVAHARAVLAAVATAQEQGTGAVQLDGQMLDEAVAVAARRVLARVPAEVLA
jgi:citrate lyase subunit beta/citryl-CoA lyase